MTNKINIDKKYIRSQIVDNQLYYCAKDLCDYLKLKNVTDFSNFIEDSFRTLRIENYVEIEDLNEDGTVIVRFQVE